MTAAKQTNHARPNGPDTDAANEDRAPLRAPRLVEAGRAAQAHGLSRMIEGWQEQLAFVSRRLESDRELIHDLAAVRTLSDWSSVWLRFVGAAQTEYRDELARLLDRSAMRLREATTAAQEQVSALAGVTGVTEDEHPSSAKAA